MHGDPHRCVLATWLQSRAVLAHPVQPGQHYGHGRSAAPPFGDPPRDAWHKPRIHKRLCRQLRGGFENRPLGCVLPAIAGWSSRGGSKTIFSTDAPFVSYARSRPPAFAAYKAISARLIQLATVSPATNSASPPLAVTGLVQPSMIMGRCPIDRRICSACCRTSPAVRPQNTTTNSSPPNRPTASVASAFDRRAAATWTRHLSPIKWPYKSLK